jgi:hypothetical protein
VGKDTTHGRAAVSFRKEKLLKTHIAPLLHKFRKQENQSHGFSANVFEEEKRTRDHSAAMVGFGRRAGRGQTCYSLVHVFATEEEEHSIIPSMFYTGRRGSHNGYPHRIPERERRAGITAVCIFSKEENQSHWSFANVLREERRESIAVLP